MSLDPNKASYMFWIDGGDPNVIVIEEREEFGGKPVPDDFDSVQREMERTFHTTLADTPFLHIDKAGGYHGYMERGGSLLAFDVQEADVENAVRSLRDFHHRQSEGEHTGREQEVQYGPQMT